MIGIGIDIVENDRVKKSIYNDRFVKRILSKEELERFNSFNEKRRLEFLSGRFAAKEAIIKCLSGYEVPSMKDLNIENDINGKPIINYKNYIIILSISHEIHYSTAIAVLQEVNQ